jgi:hypothetical protein
MKKYLSALVVFMAVIATLTGCNKNTPKDVAKTWLDDVYHLDYEGAKKFSTEGTKNFISQLQILTPKLSDSERIQLKSDLVTIKEIKIADDNASVIYTTSEMPDKEHSLKLIKQGDKWLVQFTKADRVNEAPEAEPASIQAAEADSIGAVAPGDNDDDTTQKKGQ